MSTENKTEANGPEVAQAKEEAKPENNYTGPPLARLVTGLFRTIAIEENDVSTNTLY